jgi:DNA-binding transcriptional MocR family regulator
LKQHLGALASWQLPAGGLFFWLTLNQKLDTRLLLAEAIEADVAFMPGEPFMPIETQGTGQIRLNFSHASEAQAERGLATLANLIQRYGVR